MTMGSLRVAILGCGTVGGGVAKILLEQREVLATRAGVEIELAKILDLFPAASSKRHGLPMDLYCGDSDELSREEAGQFTEEILKDDSIDLVVETIGGSGKAILDIALSVLDHGKHLATANKALLAKHGQAIFAASNRNGRAVGFEAAVCGAIPIIKGIRECFSGDEILAISGILNGTSNYILSKMEAEGQSFDAALKQAQDQGYAEADPALDINGGDPGHKLILLLKLVFGLDVDFEDLSIEGIESITSADINFAQEMGCSIKLIGYAKKEGDDVFAAVRPMLVKRKNLLSDIQGATNAVRLDNRYSQENVLIGQGAGSLETGSAIVSDILFLAKYGENAVQELPSSDCRLRSFNELAFPYNIVFTTADVPGITGIVATAIGNQQINIDTVSHNRHDPENAVFSIATMPCTYDQIQAAIVEIQDAQPGSLLKDPKVIPILGE